MDLFSANLYDVTINCQELTKLVDLLCWKIMHNNDLQALVSMYRPHPKLWSLFSVKKSVAYTRVTTVLIIALS